MNKNLNCDVKRVLLALLSCLGLPTSTISTYCLLLQRRPEIHSSVKSEPSNNFTAIKADRHVRILKGGHLVGQQAFIQQHFIFPIHLSCTIKSSELRLLQTFHSVLLGTYSSFRILSPLRSHTDPTHRIQHFSAHITLPITHV